MQKGHVYIIYNDIYIAVRYTQYGDDVYKIGKAKDITKRLNAYTTSYITPVELVFLSASCKDAQYAEQTVFAQLKKHRIVKNREFFKCGKAKIIATIETVINEINNMTDEAIEKAKTNVKVEKQKQCVIKSHKVIKYEPNELIAKIKMSDNDFDKLNDDIVIRSKLTEIRAIQKELQISLDDLDVKHPLKAIDFYNDIEFKSIQKQFRCRKHKPETRYDLLRVYVTMIKNVCGHDIIVSKQERRNKTKSRVYTFFLQVA